MSPRSWTNGARGIVAVWLALAATGCATTPARSPDTRSPVPGRTAGGAAEPRPTDEPPPVSPMPGTPVGTTASGGQITSGSARPSLLDTLPSAEALEVLGSIPEPLTPGERVPPPGGSSAAPRDTTEDDAEGDVPVPSPTRPLGDRPAPPTIPDTTSRSGGGTSTPPSSSAPPPSSEPSPPAAGAHADSCWRIQVAAKPERERSQALRDAAQSQLGGAWVVELEGRLYKVRSGDCLSMAAAEQLRRRAEAAGFTGAFRIRKK